MGQVARHEFLVSALALIALSAPVALPTRVHAQIASVELATRITASVVRIESLNDGGDDNIAGFLEGVLIDPDGHIVFNEAESLIKAGRAAVVLPGGARYIGTVVGRDAFNNIAILKIQGTDYVLPTDGNAERLQSGDAVYTVDISRKGFPSVVLARVVNPSRVARPEGSSIGPYIEMEVIGDVRLPRGPVFDQTGELVGFVTLENRPPIGLPSILARPIDQVRRIANELRISGKVRRARIGLDITKNTTSGSDQAEPVGARIVKAEAGGPAARGGLLPGDIILKVGEYIIRNTDDYVIAMERIKPGTVITVRVLRVDKMLEFKVLAGVVLTGP